jgi:hypothetical protein
MINKNKSKKRTSILEKRINLYKISISKKLNTDEPYFFNFGWWLSN